MGAHAPLTRVLDHVRRTAELHPAAIMREEFAQRDDAAHVSIAYNSLYKVRPRTIANTARVVGGLH